MDKILSVEKLLEQAKTDRILQDYAASRARAEMPEPASEEEAVVLIERKTKEMAKLRNKLRRYEKRLVSEGFKIAGRDSHYVPLKEISDEDVDASPLVRLARNENISLYRRYLFGKEKYKAGVDFLNALTKD